MGFRQLMSSSPNTPIRLAVAAEKFGLSSSALRREAHNGRLVIFRVAGKDWTTELAVREMFDKCRVKAKSYDSGSSQNDGRNVGTLQNTPTGSSKTEASELARAAALATANKLKQNSRRISSANILQNGLSSRSQGF